MKSQKNMKVKSILFLTNLKIYILEQALCTNSLIPVEIQQLHSQQIQSCVFELETKFHKLKNVR